MSSQGRADYYAGMRKKRARFHNKSAISLGDMGKQVLAHLDDNSLVLKQFKEYAAELDEKHDRFEKLVKIGRDITIESKRIIFLLHTLDKKEKKDAILNEAEKRLESMTKSSFKIIAKELNGHDLYQYLRAYQPGIQEFVEAVTFHEYLRNKNLLNWYSIEKSFSYPAEDGTAIVTLSLNPYDYILGIADLTGELMRKCINNLSSGNITGCFETCDFVRSMYRGFLICTGISGKEITRKMFTLKQSLNKIENVCYTIKIRGSEIPKHMLATVAIAEVEDNVHNEDDEGFHQF